MDKERIAPEGASATNFIREAIAEDLRAGRFATVRTRYPPEPNAYIHIGHAKAIWISYGNAREFGGQFNLRFDDTNPAKEEQEFVDAIIGDVRWVGAEFGDRIFYGSDYFEPQYRWAEELVRKGKAYVCELTAEQVTAYRGTLTEPGRNSPYRDRPADESLDLFRGMRKGEFPDGARTLRAKIDMAHPNLNMRDPVMYRIMHRAHHRQGDTWCIYPMYDWAHGLQDSIEGITHSLCDLGYEDHRVLYDWFIDAINEGRTADGSGPWGKKIHHPRQIEFARLNLTHCVMSKRKFVQLVNGNHVRGYDDPRLPTLAGMRRRGYTPGSIKAFCERIGVAKRDSIVDYALLEHYIREELNKTSPRLMGVLRPLKVVITNYPEGGAEDLEAVNNPEDPAAGKRTVPFSRELYIERDDFMEDPPKNFFRLAPGREVRLRWAYFVRCDAVIKDPATGEPVELRCTYDPATRGGDAPDGRKVKATLHWVSAAHAVPFEARLYDRLFLAENPDDAPEGKDFTANINPTSLEVLAGCRGEPALAAAKPGDRIQLERLAYFCVDPDSHPGQPVLNRTVSLKDAWAKAAKG
jgi:glutaminyl-tRNA synthetase